MLEKHRLLDNHVCSFCIQVPWKICMYSRNLLKIASGKKEHIFYKNSSPDASGFKVKVVLMVLKVMIDKGSCSEDTLPSILEL